MRALYHRIVGLHLGVLLELQGRLVKQAGKASYLPLWFGLHQLHQVGFKLWPMLFFSRG